MIKKLLGWLTGEMFRFYIGGGGGGQQQQQPTTQTVQQTNLPAWAQPYSEQLLGKAQALTDINQNPYQSYGGNRLADFTPMQQQAFQNIGGMQVSPQTGQATGLAGMAGIGGLGAGQQYAQMATDPTAISAYMSPYMQNVVDYQKQQAIRDYSRALPGLGAQAAQFGAFGGSRQALVESEAQRNLQNQLAGIQATGSQNAFNAAQQAQQFGAGLGMQGLGLAGQAAQTLGQLGQQQYGQQMGINAALQQAGAQQQALAQQGLTNQYQDYLNQMNYPYQQLAFMSDILHGTPTGGITTAQTYQAAPSMFSQIAGGLGGIGSLVGAYNAANKAEGGIIGYKEGGEVKGYAYGGTVNPGIAAAYLTDHMDRVPSPQETMLANLANKPPAGLSPQLLAAMELNRIVTDQEKQQPAQTPTSTVAQDLALQVLAQNRPQNIGQGLGGMPSNLGDIYDNAQNEQVRSAAHGGIIAFAGGKKVPSPEEIAETKAALEELGQGNEQRFREAREIQRREMLPDSGGMIPTQAVISDYEPYKPDFVAKPEGIISQLFGAVTGSSPAYGAQNAPSSTSDEQPESAIGAWFRRQKGADKYVAEERARQEALQNMYKSIVPFYEAVTPTQRRERDADYEKYRQQSMQYSGIATPAPVDDRREFARYPAALQAEKPFVAKPPTTEAAAPADAAAKKPIEFLDTIREKLLGQLNAKPAMTREEYDTRMDNIAKKYGVDPESTKKFFDDQTKSLIDQITQARKDKDVGLWLASAQAFFAMAGGVSPYALKNFADGMGIGVKQITAVMSDYNKAQNDINKAKRELAKLELIDRRDMSKAEMDRLVKFEDMKEKAEDRQFRVLSTLYGGELSRAQIQAYRESTLADKRTANLMHVQQLRNTLIERAAKELQANPMNMSKPFDVLMREAAQAIDAANPNLAAALGITVPATAAPSIDTSKWKNPSVVSGSR